jgi:hypothetical protein
MGSKLEHDAHIENMEFEKDCAFNFEYMAKKLEQHSDLLSTKESIPILKALQK